LPGSKRYADTESEYTTLLQRYNTVLDELFAGEAAHVVTTSYRWEHELANADPLPYTLNPGSSLWMTLRYEDEGDEYVSCVDLLVSTHTWRPGMLNPLLSSRGGRGVEQCADHGFAVELRLRPVRRWSRLRPG
jgi:hypothetical protein